MSYELIKYLQKKFQATNSNVPVHEPVQTIFGDQYYLFNDIRYSDQFPNSFLDLYVSADRISRRPTLFYTHGGGYAWGTKSEGGYETVGRGFGWYFKSFLDAGFNVVSIDYALAPEFGYPTPIVQMSQAVTFLLGQGKQYGIDMSQVILAGGSAGGQLSGQFAMIQIDPDYAAEIQINPVLSKNSIKAIVFSSALLDNNRFGKTNFWMSNYLFSRLGQAYYHCKCFAGQPSVVQSDVLSHVSDAFPPCFISDANTASFSDQAFDLAAKLAQLGVRHEINYYPLSIVRLLHGFEYEDTPYAKENLLKTLRFLSEILHLQNDSFYS